VFEFQESLLKYCSYVAHFSSTFIAAGVAAEPCVTRAADGALTPVLPLSPQCIHVAAEILVRLGSTALCNISSVNAGVRVRLRVIAVCIERHATYHASRSPFIVRN
jgi:hypothetical protein